MDTRRNIIISVTLQTEKSQLGPIDTSAAQESIRRLETATSRVLNQLSARGQAVAKGAIDRAFRQETDLGITSLDKHSRALKNNADAFRQRTIAAEMDARINERREAALGFSTRLQDRLRIASSGRLSASAAQARRLQGIAEALARPAVISGAAFDNRVLTSRATFRELRQQIEDRAFREAAFALERDFGLTSGGFVGPAPGSRFRLRTGGRAQSTSVRPIDVSGAVSSIGVLATSIGQLAVAADNSLSPMSRIVNLLGGVTTAGIGGSGLLRALGPASAVLATPPGLAVAALGVATAGAGYHYARAFQAYRRLNREVEPFDPGAEHRERLAARAAATKIVEEEKRLAIRQEIVQFRRDQVNVDSSIRQRAARFDLARANLIEDPQRRFQELNQSAVRSREQLARLNEEINRDNFRLDGAPGLTGRAREEALALKRVADEAAARLRALGSYASPRDFVNGKLGARLSRDIDARLRGDQSLIGEDNAAARARIVELQGVRENEREQLANTLLANARQRAGLEDDASDRLLLASRAFVDHLRRATPLDRADPRFRERTNQLESEFGAAFENARRLGAAGDRAELDRRQEAEQRRLLETQQQSQNTQDRIAAVLERLEGVMDANTEAIKNWPAVYAEELRKRGIEEQQQPPNPNLGGNTVGDVAARRSRRGR